MRKALLLLFLISIAILISCSKSTTTDQISYPAITAAFGGNIDPKNWINYAGQTIPAYINKDNARGTVVNLGPGVVL
jgi:hypothetical protein